MRFRSQFFLRKVQFFKADGDGRGFVGFGGFIFLVMQGQPRHKITALGWVSVSIFHNPVYKKTGSVFCGGAIRPKIGYFFDQKGLAWPKITKNGEIKAERK
jgi:hypothetical protein